MPVFVATDAGIFFLIVGIKINILNTKILLILWL